MLPALITAAAQAYSAYEANNHVPAAATAAGSGTFAPGGIIVGSKVVGSGSAATSIPAAAVTPGATATPFTATAGMPAWLQSPWVWVAAGGLLLGLVLAFILPPRRKREIHPR